MTRRVLLVALPLLLAACPALDPMQRQQKVKPYQTSAYYTDGQGMRAPPAGTVPAGLPPDPALDAGVGPDGRPLAVSPIAPTPRLLALGRKRFEIHCAVCHGLLGDGESQVALNMSLRKPANLHLYRGVPDGYLYQVISRGFGLMPSYAPDLGMEERWAVVAYLRALQLSQHAPVDLLPAAARSHLTQEKP